jgi:valyl-tRNA synthetase
MEPRYEHLKYEQEIYGRWQKSGAFSPPPPSAKAAGGQNAFSIVMPPPNANDPLHLGHAMFVAIEDILIRYHRMRGEATLWLPGTDHAGIETQYVFEKKLKKEGKSRFNYDREALYRMIWDYVHDNSQIALAQMKRLGATADWTRLKFTLDNNVVDFVLATFEKMHKDDLIYRGLRLVNYCPKCGTGYSELEVKYVEQNDPLYYIKYGPLELATVRPETKFGDTAVAVNPRDRRYQMWVGKEIEVDGLLGKFKLKVVADNYVDPKFGTGVVKITPAHDPNDYEMGLRHKLKMKQVVGFDGKLNELTGPYAGMKVKEARQKIVEDLNTLGMITKVDEAYVHNVATCYRCGGTIEPLPIPQFFVRVKPLTTKALEALENQETIIYGAGHDKILKYWLNNLRDWNISRQIVWGIRMPVWYQIVDSEQRTVNGNIVVGFLDKDKKYIQGKIGELLLIYPIEEIEKGLQMVQAPQDAKYQISRIKPGDGYLQETDTFDTWFSSSQWPVVTLRSQETRNMKRDLNSDFERFYPTSVMETAYDILPFWVMRMMMMGIYLTGKTPFKKVYFHGLVRDEKGQKMSKSKGNVINPIDIVDKYGADALRMALVMSTTAGHDSACGEMKVKGMRNLSNKIWNAARFMVMNRENPIPKNQMTNNPQVIDEEFLTKLMRVVKTVTRQMDDLKIGLAAETVYNEFWHWFCDQAIESFKRGNLSGSKLEIGMRTFLELLHPFMPYVTEVCWQELGYSKDSPLLLTAKWPEDIVIK